MIVWLPMFLSGVVSLAAMSAGPAPAPRRAAGPVPRDRAAAPEPRDPSIPAVRAGSIPYAALLNAPDRRVRTTDPRMKALLEEGVRRSATMADLVAAISATDVIVYLQRVSRLAPGIAGQLMIVPIPGEQRYLRIQVLDHLSKDETIALIGHELRHALEVAIVPQVHDQAGLVRLYEEIGERGYGLHSFDTRAAQSTGQRVKLELAG